MKKVVNDNELYEYMDDAINLLCNTVKKTLGPKGSNIIIDHSSFSPLITNDGVTIASNIESEDPITNTILELAKEASIKTNDNVGDGTTTTLVLLQSIFNNGLKLIKEQNINPIILKKELNVSLDKIINKLKKINKKPTQKELLNIATISANDINIGKLVYQAFAKTKSKSAINIVESTNTNDSLIFTKGYKFTTDISPYFFQEKAEIIVKRPNVLIIDNYLTDLNDIAIILNHVIQNKDNLIIIAKDYSEEIISEIITINEENNTNILLLKILEYGFKQQTILKDLELLTNSQMINTYNFVSLNNLGTSLSIKINKDAALLEFKENENIVNKIANIKKEILNCNDEYEKEFHYQRLAMFQKGLATILVTAPTLTERREKKMRFDDALCAISCASYGIVPGSGITFMKIQKNLNENSLADTILKKALSQPFQQIINNAAINDEIVNIIKKSDFNKIYNISNNEIEDIKNTLVIDPTYVLINSLTNAVSIATMLLTTNSLIINENQNNIKKINDYTEL